MVCCVLLCRGTKGREDQVLLHLKLALLAQQQALQSTHSVACSTNWYEQFALWKEVNMPAASTAHGGKLISAGTLHSF